MKTELLRVDKKMEEEIRHIQTKVKELSRKKYSIREITYWFPKHQNFKQIKEDVAINLIELAKVKKGRPKNE